MDDPIVDKAVIIAGTSGTGLRSLYKCLEKGKLRLPENTCVFHFEDVLLEEPSNMPCSDIEQITALMLTSKPSAMRLFRNAIEKIRARAEKKGCQRLIVIAHLTYLSHRSIITNPVLGDLLNLGVEASIIYMTEDFYDALYDMALSARDRIYPGRKGCSSIPSIPYSIDPVLYLTWRAADINVLNIAENIKPGTTIYLFGVKHPYQAFQQLLTRVLMTRKEELSSEAPPTAYVSHPITQVREVFVALRHTPLRDIPLAYMIEAFKDAIRRRKPGLVLFEPTTIDETHKDWLSRIMAKIPQASTISLCEKLCKTQPQQREFQDRPVTHSIVVDSYNRWPVARDNLREYCEGQRTYDYLVEGEISLLDDIFSILYGKDLYEHIVLDVAYNNFATGEMGDRLKGIISTQINDMVLAQIEERDYAYVSQSDFIIAVTTAVIVPEGVEGLEPGVYIPYSTGMDAEIQRARALTKPTIYYILSLCLEALEKKAESDEARKALYKAVKHGFRRCDTASPVCDDETAVKAVRDCAVRVQEGGLFSTIGGGVRVCTVPVVVRGGESYKELVKRYAESLC